MSKLLLENSLYLNTDIERSKRNWATRVKKMGQYATGPSKWASENMKNPQTLLCFEEQEERFSKEILDFILPHIQPEHKMMVVGVGPGRRLDEYLSATRGECFGVDFLPSMVSFSHEELTSKGWDFVCPHFVQGYGSNLLGEYASHSFNWLMWERFGNHILKEKDWIDAIDEASSALSEKEGHFFLAESILDLNERKPSRDSRFRFFSKYMRELHQRGFEIFSAKQTKFAGDNYILAIFRRMLVPGEI